MPTLNWIGKDKVVNHHKEVPYCTLEKKYAFGDANSGNKIIHGDNLLALKALLPHYEGRIKCIYIDPPYNTGNEKWVYNDNVNSPRIQKWLHEVVGKEGEDLTRHDKWLCMMYPRLTLLRQLLADDGAIFISIDDNEQAYLKLLCDEIFGAGNFVGNIIWQKKFSPQNDAKWFSDNHDFIICYAKNKTIWRPNLLTRSDSTNLRYNNPDNDFRGPWASTDLAVKTYSADYDYPITTPSGRIVLPSNGRCWMTSKERMQELIADNRIWFGRKGNNVPRYKTFLSEVQQGIVPLSIWLHTVVGHNQEAKQELKKIFSSTHLPFNTPKPTRLLEQVLNIASNKDSIILDSFAGSGTTAHAVLNLNKDGGNRKFILVEMEDYAESITAERVRRVINGYGEGKNAVAGTGGAFDYYELGEPLFNADKNLNENVGTEKIRAYIWYTETKTPYCVSEKPADNTDYYLGSHNSTAYYFYYKADKITTLNYNFLATVKVTAEQYIIYADNCLLSKTYMQKHNIIFKKIPRDIRRF